MKLDELKRECLKFGYELSDKQLNQFDEYATFLKEYNEKINLTTIVEYEEIVEKHFFDSLLPFLKRGIKGNLADVGSGAGFPSIPLKIVFQNLNVTIIEPLNKRCVFLNKLISKLELNNVTIINARAEDYVKNNREQFDVVTARAVANLNLLSELCVPLVKVNGLFVAMKGAQGIEEYRNAEKAIRTLGCELDKIDQERLSDNSQRINISLRKIKKTPKEYPRIFSKMKKDPM